MTNINIREYLNNIVEGVDRGEITFLRAIVGDVENGVFPQLDPTCRSQTVLNPANQEKRNYLFRFDELSEDESNGYFAPGERVRIKTIGEILRCDTLSEPWAPREPILSVIRPSRSGRSEIILTQIPEEFAVNPAEIYAAMEKHELLDHYDVLTSLLL
jgi:hypothetical protein